MPGLYKSHLKFMFGRSQLGKVILMCLIHASIKLHIPIKSGAICSCLPAWLKDSSSELGWVSWVILNTQGDLYVGQVMCLHTQINMSTVKPSYSQLGPS